MARIEQRDLVFARAEVKAGELFKNRPFVDGCFQRVGNFQRFFISRLGGAERKVRIGIFGANVRGEFTGKVRIPLTRRESPTGSARARL